MPPKDQGKLLLANCAVAQNTEIRVRLFQLKVRFRHLFAMLGERAYYIRWIQPKEIAHTVPDKEDRSSLACRHWVNFNKNIGADRMGIVNIVHVWGVYGTELRDEIE